MIELRGVTHRYPNGLLALDKIDLTIPEGQFVGLVGPNGSGKSTLLKLLALLLAPTRGQLLYGGQVAAGREGELRREVTLLLQEPFLLKRTVFENVAYGLRVRGERSKTYIEDKVEAALKGAAIWNEVKDRLDEVAVNLSGGQQQRLCIARTLALNPDVILFDEPCSALDPISTLAIEDLMSSIVADRAIVIVTHNMEQASRVSNRTAFFYMGDMVEYDETDEIFQRPKDKRLNDYLTGMFS